MKIKIALLLLLVISIAGCGALAAEVSSEMAPQISTEVSIQVGTAVADLPAAGGQSSPDEPATSAVAFDCAPKFCKDMNSCEEAVYQLYVCGHSARDANDDGVPCESLCRGSDVPAIATSFAGVSPTAAPTLPPGAEESGLVTRVVDGDTIDVMLNGVNTRIRYLQMNTPERDHLCFDASSKANADLVTGKTVRLVPDKELVDPFDRLLRFVYVDDVLVNRVLVEQGWAEVVIYPPNDLHYDEFVKLEQAAAAAGLGCHPTGVFDDGSTTR